MECRQITQGGRQAFYFAEDENIPQHGLWADVKELKNNRFRERNAEV